MVEHTKTTLDSWKLLMIVREPIDRFLSGFLTLCVIETVETQLPSKCYGCGKDVACVLTRLYERASSFAADRNNFVLTHEDNYWFPQNWFCSLARYRRNFHTLKYWPDHTRRQQMMNELKDILLKAKVPTNNVDTIIARTNSYGNNTDNYEKYRLFYHDIITSSSKLQQLFSSIYFHDYELFQFPYNYSDSRVFMERRAVSGMESVMTQG
uniref:Sulfotransfer_1 domain-containing protein n=1 Tax=Steinernema glaseri TaxID=37863 RepID=A0A1I8AG33_9BILA